MHSVDPQDDRVAAATVDDLVAEVEQCRYLSSRLTIVFLAINQYNVVLSALSPDVQECGEQLRG